MSSENIGSPEEEAFKATMLRIEQGRSAVPEYFEISKAVGTKAGVAANFHETLFQAANALASLVEKVLVELDATSDAIRATVADLVATDEASADEADAILKMLDSTVNPEDNALAQSRNTGISVANQRQAF